MRSESGNTSGCALIREKACVGPTWVVTSIHCISHKHKTSVYNIIGGLLCTPVQEVMLEHKRLYDLFHMAVAVKPFFKIHSCITHTGSIISYVGRTCRSFLTFIIHFQENE